MFDFASVTVRQKSKDRSINGEAGIVGDTEEIIHHDQLQVTTADQSPGSHEDEVVHLDSMRAEGVSVCQPVTETPPSSLLVKTTSPCFTRDQLTRHLSALTDRVLFRFY